MGVKFDIFTGTLVDDNTHYRHVQGSPASTWTVRHNLGYYPGGIAVQDSAGEVRVGRIEYVDRNTVAISFFKSGAPVAFSGEAFIS